MAAFDNASLLLERSFAKDGANRLADAQNILVANYLEDGYCIHLASQFPDKQFTGFSYNFANHQSIVGRNANLTALCSHQLDEQQQYDCLVIYFPKSKPEFEYLINNLFNHVKVGAPVYVVGDNKGGVKSCEKALVPFCTKLQKSDAAKHCALFLTTLNEPSPPFVVADWYKCYEVKINNVELEIYSLPGVFSYGNLDDGTRLLLESVSEQAKAPQGRLLDFGCGAGLIGAFLAKLNPKATVTGLDVSALAIASSLKTFAANGIEGEVLLSNGLAQLEGEFDQVYSNPPFHSGVKTNYAVTELFLTSIKQYLAQNGSLTVVANSFLKYQPLLEQQFGSYLVQGTNRRFNVYYATKAKA